jgi:hypothetical protein
VKYDGRVDPLFGEMLDTPLEARTRYYQMLARLTPEQRARKVAGLGRAARALARAGIRRTRPDAGPSEIEIELVARLYGEAAVRQLAPYLRSRCG